MAPPQQLSKCDTDFKISDAIASRAPSPHFQDVSGVCRPFYVATSGIAYDDHTTSTQNMLLDEDQVYCVAIL